MFAMTKNPTMKTSTKVTMSRKTTTTAVQQRVLRIVWSSFPFLHCKNLFVFSVFFGLYGVAASALVVRPCIGLCSRPVFHKKRRKSIVHLLFCENLLCRIACILVRACALGTSRPRGSAPRSFRNFVSLRNPSNLLLSCVFVIKQSFHNVDPLSILQCSIVKFHGRT